jgi:uncharacterized protein YkwD
MESNTTNFEQQVIDLTNAERVKNGLQPLQPNAELNYTADNYAEEMAENGFFSHTGLDGSKPWDRAKEVGYEAQLMGENIGRGQRSPEQVVQGWMNSPGHRANILNEKYTEIGTGFHQNYWVQNFGSGDLNPATNIPTSASNPETESQSTPALEPISTPVESQPTSNPDNSPNSNQTIPQPDVSSNSFEPTAYEQYMLELVNRARANPQAEEQRQGISLTEGLKSGRISYDPSQPLAWDDKLSQTAQEHNQWMEETGKFSHYGDGGWPWERAYQTGYDMTAPQGSQANENLSMGSGSKPKSATQYVEERHNSLYGSSGHRRNFFNPNWKEAGIDFLGKQAKDGQNLTKATVVQFFGNPASGDTFLTGVAYDDNAVKDDDFYTPGEGLGGVKVEAVRLSDNQVFTTETFNSGGYQIALEPGDYQVTFSGDSLSQPVTDTVNIGSQNKKIDMVTDKAVQGISSPSFNSTNDPLTPKTVFDAYLVDPLASTNPPSMSI